MSRGPGRIEIAIGAALDAEPDRAFTTDELCQAVYRGINQVHKKHRVAVLRAASRLAGRRHTLRQFTSESLGGTIVFFNCDNVTSYAMARLKADRFSRYHRGDTRIPDWNWKSEADLLAKLSFGGDHHRFVVEGGAWWLHVQSWIAEIEAERTGDSERLQAVLAERRAHDQAILRSLGRGTTAPAD